MRNTLYKIAKYLFLVLMALIIISLVINANLVYDSKQPVNTILDLVIACLLVIVLFFIKPINKNFTKKTYLLLFVIVLIVQILVFNSILFRTGGWDARIIFNDARSISNNYSELIAFDYYSMYPNNMFLCTFYSLIFSLLKLVGIVDKRSLLLSIVIINCVISNITCLIIYKIVSKHSNSKYSLIAYIIALILTAFSPWNLIPYSDELALIIPVSILLIYESSYKDIIKVIIISLLTFVGYSLKPQSIIIVIAIIIVSIINSNKTNIKNIIKSACVSLLIFLTCFLLINNIYSSLGFTKDKNKELGVIHYLMMGLNTDTYGAYSQIDADSSMNSEYKSDRDVYNIKLIKNRLSSIKDKGILDFVTKKIHITFNDGSFSWGKEGEFYDDDLSLNTPFTTSLKDYYYNEGKYFSIYVNLVEVVWFVVLISTLLMIFNKESSYNVIIITLIGAILFQLIFETRARYLYVNIPIFIIVTVIGLYSCYSKLAKN